MKKLLSIIILFTCISAVLTLSCSASAIPEERLLPRIVDNADILTDTEEETLTNLYDEISENFRCDIAAVTVTTLDGMDVQSYADDFYDYNGYGMGSDDNGVLFLIAMNEREWAFTTYGFAMSALPNYILESIGEEILPYLSSGYYHDALTYYANTAASYIEHYKENGSAYGENENNPNDYNEIYYYNDGQYYEKNQFSIGAKIGISLLIGAVISLIIMLIMKSGMRTIKSNNYAASYIVDNSLQINVSRDLYLYRNVTKTRRETESSGRGGGGTHTSGRGGGGTHTSSSGRSHGGASGRF